MSSLQVRGGVAFETRAAIEELYAQYAFLLDARRYDEWLALFIDECTYVVKPRENDDRGLPLAAIAFESIGMLRDRIYGIDNTLFHEPYYQRHLITNFLIRPVDRGYSVGANYLVARTKTGALSEVYSAGRYRDLLVEFDGELRFAEKIAVYDSELIPNSLIYPI